MIFQPMILYLSISLPINHLSTHDSISVYLLIIFQPMILYMFICLSINHLSIHDSILIFYLFIYLNVKKSICVTRYIYQLYDLSLIRILLVMATYFTYNIHKKKTLYHIQLVLLSGWIGSTLPTEH